MFPLHFLLCCHVCVEGLILISFWYVVAGLTEPLSCIAHGWDRITPIAVGSRILILGAGIIGNLWASILHLQGHRRVMVSEPQEARRKLLEKLGSYDQCWNCKI
jgi:threonine dehydrogenase-like Zn-dependent dehydrogenase